MSKFTSHRLWIYRYHLKLRETTNSPSPGERHYLPDFFTKTKHQTKNPLQVDGKFIQREEKEFDKESAVDGIGINFKLRQ